MATFVKFNCFVEDVAEGKHNFATATFYVCLTNSAPVASNTILANLTQISAGTGYTDGGNAAAMSSSAQSSGTYKLVLADPTSWTGSGAGMGPFRYAVLYNGTATDDPLIGFWDYGSSITLAAGEVFTVDFSADNGVLQIV